MDNENNPAPNSNIIDKQNEPKGGGDEEGGDRVHLWSKSFPRAESSRVTEGGVDGRGKQRYPAPDFCVRRRWSTVMDVSRRLATLSLYTHTAKPSCTTQRSYFLYLTNEHKIVNFNSDIVCIVPFKITKYVSQTFCDKVDL